MKIQAQLRMFNLTYTDHTVRENIFLSFRKTKTAILMRVPADGSRLQAPEQQLSLFTRRLTCPRRDANRDLRDLFVPSVSGPQSCSTDA